MRERQAASLSAGSSMSDFRARPLEIPTSFLIVAIVAYGRAFCLPSGKRTLVPSSVQASVLAGSVEVYE